MDKQMTSEKKKIKPDLPGGFRDCGSKEMLTKQKILDTFRQTAESFGYEPLETSSVQKTEVLTGGEENSSKIIFGVKSSREEDYTEYPMSLRFDLTVPLARFVAANLEAPKPFKRYEIGKVWRGERQQAGRYREFTQADIDIVGTPLLEADAEILTFMYRFLEKLDVKNFVIKINFRDEAAELLKKYGVPEDRQTATLTEVDKKEKLPTEEWQKRIALVSGLKEKNVKKYTEELAGEPPKNSVYYKLINLLEKSGLDTNKFAYDGAVVRGLAYYTGAVFETILQDCPEIGSFFSGGKYDNLMETFTGQKIPAVGTSLGVDRLLAGLEKIGKNLEKEKTIRVLILRLLPDTKEYSEFAEKLRGAGVSAFLYLGKDDMLQNQLAYALEKDMPFVLIYGEKEKEKGVVSIKNLQTREQKEVPKTKILEYFGK